MDLSYKNESVHKIEESKARFLRIIWVDLNSKMRCKSVHVAWLLKNRDSFTHVTVTDSGTAFPLLEDMILREALPSDDIGEIWLVPDWTSLHFYKLPQTDGVVAQVFGRFYQTLPPPNSTLTPFSLCSRQVLLRAIEQLQSLHGLALKGSFEEEFYLFSAEEYKKSGAIVPLDKGQFASILSLDAHQDVLDDICETLTGLNIPVEQVLKESGPGQFEITIDYVDILAACDRHKIIHQVVRSTASKHGFIATFLPKVFLNAAGSGSHVHLSLWKEGKNIVPDATRSTGFSETAERFVAGIIHHALGLTAIFNATPINSYYRLKPNTWSGSYSSWGLDNKEVFIRVPTSPDSPTKGNTNFEVKTIDHTANPYLAMAAIIFSGMHALETPSIKVPPMTSKNPANMSDKEKLDLLIKPLPSTLTDAISHLSSDTYLCSSLSPTLVETYTKIKKYDIESLKTLDFNQQIQSLLEIF